MNTSMVRELKLNNWIQEMLLVSFLIVRVIKVKEMVPSQHSMESMQRVQKL